MPIVSVKSAYGNVPMLEHQIFVAQGGPKSNKKGIPYLAANLKKKNPIGLHKMVIEKMVEKSKKKNKLLYGHFVYGYGSVGMCDAFIINVSNNTLRMHT